MSTQRVMARRSKRLLRPMRAHAAKAGPDYAKQLGEYLAGLTPRQKGDLSGLRDRIAALGRSDMAAWLDPDRNPTAPRFNLAAAVQNSAVVLFTLQADDYPMLSKKLAAAIVLDLIAVAQQRQTRPIPTFVAIDEFGAIDSDLVLRLPARARGAGFYSRIERGEVDPRISSLLKIASGLGVEPADLLRDVG